MKRLVLDANLLVLLIVGNLDRSKIGARRLESFEERHLVVLNEIFRQHTYHVSTPNVLTEASNLLGSGGQQLCKGACSALGDFIASLEEIFVPSIDTLSQPFYQKLGLADAALAVLSQNGDLVLTADGPMYGMMVGYDIPVENFWHRVSSSSLAADK